MHHSVCVFATMCVVLVACADDRAAPPIEHRQPVPPIAAEAPRPPAPPPDLGLGNGFAMRHPVRDGRLSLIPIVATDRVAAPDYLTLTDGEARHLVTIREMPHWQVHVVRIRNKSAQPLFVMRGELIFDGHQDRVLAEDRVIPPHHAVEVAVDCVERERSSGSQTFHSGQTFAELELRRSDYRDQLDIWRKVAQINERRGLHPPTGTYRLAAQAQDGARRDRLIAALARDPEAATFVGLAVAVDGEVIAIDRFATPGLFQALEKELIGGYVASDGGPPHEGRTPLPADVRALWADDKARSSTAASTISLRSM